MLVEYQGELWRDREYEHKVNHWFCRWLEFGEVYKDITIPASEKTYAEVLGRVRLALTGLDFIKKISLKYWADSLCGECGQPKAIENPYLKDGLMHYTFTIVFSRPDMGYQKDWLVKVDDALRNT